MVVFTVVTLATLVAVRRDGVPAKAAAEQFCSGDNLAVGANWSVCWEVRANEGLAITHAFYVKDGAARRVLSDATVAQIFVPYETGSPRYHDVAYGLGPAMGPLTAAECHGGTLLYGNRVCRQVEDNGPVERFCSEGNCHVRMGKSLAIWASSQMGAYNYITKWEFKDDGGIEPAMGLSGILQFGPRAHTHNVYWRMDFDIDGAENDSVEEFYRISPAYGDGSTGSSSWVPILGETYKTNDLDTFRRWRVVDTERTNASGRPLSYEILPHAGDGNYRGTQEEGFTRGELWITQAKPGERFVSTEQADLLSGYVDGDAVDSDDVVLWYAIHEHHQVRSEDGPYMPTMWISFEAHPRDFFDESPLN